MGRRGAGSGPNVVCFVGVVGCLRGPAGYYRHIAAFRRVELGRNKSVTDDTVQMSSVQVFAPVCIISTDLLLLKMGNNWDMQDRSKKGIATLND